MTNDQLTPNQPPATRRDGYNVVAVSFAEDRDAYQALTLLKELDAQGRVGVQEAVVVVRDEDGHLIEKDNAGSENVAGMAGGGLIGLLLGVIGGPFGMLIGGATGVMVGSMFDLADMDETDSALSAISSSVEIGHTQLLAVVAEGSPDVLDAALSRVGGTVLRRPVADVEAEIAAAEQAEREAKREARKELLRARHEGDKAAVTAKIAEMKASLPRRHTAVSTPDEAVTVSR